MAARALVVALAIAAPIATFIVGAGLFQAWEGWRSAGFSLLEDDTTYSNVIAGLIAAVSWGGGLLIASRWIKSRPRLILLASFLGMVAAWFWIGVHQLIVL